MTLLYILILLSLYREEKKNKQASFMTSWLQKGSENKRKSTNINDSKDDEDKASKFRKED